MLERWPWVSHYAMQDVITTLRPAEAVRAAEEAAPTTWLSAAEDGMTWAVAAAVLGRVTGHPHVLVPEAEHAPILDLLLGEDRDRARQADAEHPGYVQALDLAASKAGLAALYGLVYSWEIVVCVEEPTADEAQEVESYHFTGSWADAEAAAQESLEEYVLFGGSADISTCAGSASTITI